MRPSPSHSQTSQVNTGSPARRVIPGSSQISRPAPPVSPYKSGQVPSLKNSRHQGSVPLFHHDPEVETGRHPRIGAAVEHPLDKGRVSVPVDDEGRRGTGAVIRAPDGEG